MTNDKRINPWWWVLLAIVLLTFAARQASSQRIYITDGNDTLSYYDPPDLDKVMSEGNYPNTHNFQKNDFLAYPELNIEPSKSSDNWKYFVGGSFVFVGGMWDGLSQTLAHHYSHFEVKHPNANKTYWSKAHSWQNKWKLDENGQPIVGEERFPLSSTALVFLTDGYHMARIADVGFTLIGVTVIQINEPRKEWWRYGLEIFGMFVVRSMGFELVHGIIYK